MGSTLAYDDEGGEEGEEGEGAPRLIYYKKPCEGAGQPLGGREKHSPRPTGRLHVCAACWLIPTAACVPAAVEFLNLGIMAYLGDDRALTEVGERAAAGLDGWGRRRQARCPWGWLRGSPVATSLRFAVPPMLRRSSCPSPK